MKTNLKHLVSIAFAIVLFACSRTPQSSEPVPAPKTSTETQQPKPGTEGTNTTPDSTGVNTPSDITNSSILADDTIQVQQSGLCFDSAGKEMSGQFQDATKNSPSNKTADCYDKAGALLYKGNASNCLEEMQARFGPDIIFPAQQVFPKQYEAARAQGAGGVAALKATLSSGTCKALKAKE
jgi:hypothetical protein